MDSYDLSARARLTLRGPDRVRFLHGMVTCDVAKLASGAGSRAAMLSVKGRLLADLIIFARAESLLLSMEGELGEKVRLILEKHLVMDDVEVVDETERLGELGLYGEDAPAMVARALGLDEAGLRALPSYHHVVATGTADAGAAEDPLGAAEARAGAGGILVARDPSLGGLGLRLFGPRERIQALAVALAAPVLSETAREARRIEAGTARYGVDLDEDRLVVEVNFDDAISFDKGCYLGQEVVVRATTRGRVNRRLMGLVISGEGPVAARTKLGSAAHAEAGLTTSSVVSERMGGPIALAYVHRAALEAGVPLSLADSDRRAWPLDLPFTPERAAEARARLQ